MKKSCIKMYDKKGKQSGLMMEGSVAHMETMGQPKKNLINDMPVDDNASALEMSPYKMEDKKVDEFGTLIPEGFKSDAGEVIATSRKVSSDPVSFEDAGTGIRPPKIKDVKGEVIPGAGESIFNKLPFGGVRDKDASKMFKGGRFTTVKIN